MYSIVTTNNSSVLRFLGSPALSRFEIAPHVARDGDEALGLVRSVGPAVALIDAELPGGSGFEVCAAIKADPALADTRVVLLLEGALTAEVIERLGRSGCDEVLVTPMTGEALLHKLAQLLGLPIRGRRRMRISLMASVQSCGADGPGVPGQLVDLSPEGARLALERSFGEASALVAIRHSESEPLLCVPAEVVWETRDAHGVQCGVAFGDLDQHARTVLEDFCLWEFTREPDGSCLVTFQGDFREHTRFDRLADRLSGEVVFDLAYVRYLNSAGVRHWVNFLRSLERVRSYLFVRCSVAFVSQAAMVPEVLGQGRVESFLVPYACDGCDLEEERLMQTPAVAVPGVWPPELPAFRCPRCGEELLFDDLPERFFAFLASDPRFASVV